ncbi:MAG: hypothetical protein ACI9EZ_001222 [Halobacteriales archaeon]|jgi:hypothetical protein
MTNVYAYGIIEQEDIELDIDSVAGASNVYTVDYKTLSAIVSDIDTTEPERTDEDVERHNEVLRTVMEHGDGRTVVPMSFGMAFKDTRTLKGVIRGARRAFRKALNDVDGTIELGVKLLASDPEAVDGDAVREDVDQRLGDHCINETDNDLFSDRLVLNKSYLVDRAEQGAFDDAIDEIEAEYEDDLIVQYTGPWAPYNFVDIHIGADKGGG